MLLSILLEVEDWFLWGETPEEVAKKLLGNRDTNGVTFVSAIIVEKDLP